MQKILQKIVLVALIFSLIKVQSKYIPVNQPFPEARHFSKETKEFYTNPEGKHAYEIESGIQSFDQSKLHFNFNSLTPLVRKMRFQKREKEQLMKKSPYQSESMMDPKQHEISLPKEEVPDLGSWEAYKLNQAKKGLNKKFRFNNNNQKHQNSRSHHKSPYISDAFDYPQYQKTQIQIDHDAPRVELESFDQYEHFNNKNARNFRFNNKYHNQDPYISEGPHKPQNELKNYKDIQDQHLNLSNSAKVNIIRFSKKSKKSPYQSEFSMNQEVKLHQEKPFLSNPLRDENKLDFNQFNPWNIKHFRFHKKKSPFISDSVTESKEQYQQIKFSKTESPLNPNQQVQRFNFNPLNKYNNKHLFRFNHKHSDPYMSESIMEPKQTLSINENSYSSKSDSDDNVMLRAVQYSQRHKGYSSFLQRSASTKSSFRSRNKELEKMYLMNGFKAPFVSENMFYVTPSKSYKTYDLDGKDEKFDFNAISQGAPKSQQINMEDLMRFNKKTSRSELEKSFLMSQTRFPKVVSLHSSEN